MTFYFDSVQSDLTEMGVNAPSEMHELPGHRLILYHLGAV